MAISTVLKKKTGRELCEWVFLGVKTGMRRACAEYRQLAANGQTAQAVLVMRRCLDLPHRSRIRIKYFMDNFATNYPAESMTGAEYVRQCLLLYGDATIAELNAELTTMENACITLRDHIIAGTRTWDQVATTIENNTEDESVRWTFKIVGTDIWGEAY